MKTIPAKFALYANLSTRGGAVAWLANVILCHHTNPTKRLRRLASVAERVVDGDFDGLRFGARGTTVRMSWSDFERATAAELAA